MTTVAVVEGMVMVIEGTVGAHDHPSLPSTRAVNPAEAEPNSVEWGWNGGG